MLHVLDSDTLDHYWRMGLHITIDLHPFRAKDHTLNACCLEQMLISIELSGWALGVHNVTIIISDGVYTSTSSSVQDSVIMTGGLAWWEITPVATAAIAGVAVVSVKRFKRKIIK